MFGQMQVILRVYIHYERGNPLNHMAGNIIKLSDLITLKA